MAKEKLLGTKVVLEFGGSYIRVCEVSRYKKKTIARLVYAELRSRDTAVISQEIAGLFKTHHIHGRKVILNIPRHLVMTRFLRFPSTKEEEIKDMVNIEAIKQIPYSSDDIISGFKVTNSTSEGYADVFLAVTKVKTVDRFVGIVRNAGLSIERIAVGSESLLLWFEGMRAKKALSAASSNIVIINAGVEYVNMIFLSRGKLIYVRSFSFPAQRQANENILNEVVKSITVFQRQKNLSVEKVFLTGAEKMAGGIENYLREGFPVQVEHIKQADSVEVDARSGKDFNGFSFAELVGLGLKGDEGKIDMLPDRIRSENEFHVFKSNISKTIMLFAFIILCSLGLIGKEIYDKAGMLKKLKSRILTMEPLIEKAKRMKKDIEIIKKEIRKKPLAIDVLAGIYKLTSGDISLYLVDYESNKNLVLKGSAPALNNIINYLKKLEDSNLFGSVKLKYTNNRKIKGTKITEFEIVCYLT